MKGRTKNVLRRSLILHSRSFRVFWLAIFTNHYLKMKKKSKVLNFAYRAF